MSPCWLQSETDVQLLLTSPIQNDRDVVAVRQQAKKLGELLGMAAQDQTRWATAVSEIARSVVIAGGTAHAEFMLQAHVPAPLLIVRIVERGTTLQSPMPTAKLGSTATEGMVAARRLVDHFRIDSGAAEGNVVELGKRCSAKAAQYADLEALVRQVSAERVFDPRTTLRDYDRDLLASLDEVQDKQQELLRLEQELQDTNRGVVALYAELEEKAEQLRGASEAKSRFLANVSHEFRTPLNSILALSRLLLDRVDGELGVEQDKQVGFIRRSAETLLEFVNDLLDLAKVEAGKSAVSAAEFSVEDLFRGLRGVLKPLQTSDAVQLVFEEPGSLQLYSDEGKINQILRNLIANALKYTERGEVRVSVEHDTKKQTLNFAVSDTGIGIPLEDQARIFEEFEQVAGGFQQKNKGSGLGLALSRKLARLLHGEITVKSAPGQGSTFHLCVPRDYRAVPDAQSCAPQTDRTRILVVDDEETFRYVVRHIVATEPEYELLEAADGAEGLRLARLHLPELIVLDLQMPVLDGYAVLKELATDAKTQQIPVVISTSATLTPALEQRLGAATEVLRKSTLSREVLLGAIARALRNRPPRAV
jgi:signal transduction histidine kinase/ActR/RegA family two-component response regulator